MSIQALTWVIEESTATLGGRCMLIAIANHADENGDGCWASVGTLAHEARMSERGGRAALRRLQAGGHIEWAGKSQYGTAIYRICGMGGEEETSGGGRKLTTLKVHRTSPKPSFKPLKETTPISPSSKERVNQEPDEVRQVFNYWRSAFGKNGRTKLTPERRKKIGARLRSYSVADVKRAVDGCAASEWHVRNGQIDVELICRNDTKLEAFRDKAPEPDESHDRVAEQLRAQGLDDWADEWEHG